MLSKDINFIDFKIKKKKLLLKKKLNSLLREKNQIIQSLDKSYKNNFKKKKFKSI